MKIDRIEQVDEIVFDETGLVPVIAQDARTGQVLMLAWASREALQRTLRERTMWYWSRSRATLWHKGDTSGSTQALISLHHDCDADAILALVVPAGHACHTGTRSCFEAEPILAGLERIIEERRTRPDGGHTSRLLSDANLRHKKLGEETVELVAACLAGANAEVRSEAADLLYHAFIACAARDVSVTDVLQELLSRRSASSTPPVA
jgi:phosphoribosyl-AMP cyclohydrolase / phosphoribosyl-ATP pyrophosphohydrolase